MTFIHFILPSVVLSSKLVFIIDSFGWCLKKRGLAMVLLPLQVSLYTKDARQLASRSLIVWKILPHSYTWCYFLLLWHKAGQTGDCVKHLKPENYVSHDCGLVCCSCLHVWLSASEHAFAYCGLPASHLGLTFLTGKVCFPAVASLYISLTDRQTQQGRRFSDNDTK